MSNASRKGRAPNSDDEHVPSDVALFGGSFNPPHVCHTLATLWVLQTQPVDEVWWIPTYEHAFDKQLVDFESRHRMCELATEDFDRVRIHDVERALGGESRTIDTVRALRRRHPNTEFWLVIGTDILDEVERWKNWRGLTRLVHLIVIGRQGYDGDLANATADARSVTDSRDLHLPDVNSTAIRRALAACEYGPIRPWIPRPVLDYIERHELYLGDDCP